MIVKRKKDNGNACTILNDQVLITRDNKVEKKLPQIPLKDVAIFLSYSEKDIKRDYQGISEYFDYQTVKLFLDSDMINLNYFQKYELISFNSAFCIKVHYDSEKRDFTDNPEYIPIPIAALILHISEERMKGLARLEESEFYDEDTKEHYMKATEFLSYYSDILFERVGVEADITLVLKKDCISILVERQLNDKTNEK